MAGTGLTGHRRLMVSCESVIPAQAGIQVADMVRHTGEGRYPGVAEWD